MALVSVGQPSKSIVDILEDFGTEDLNSLDPVMLNNKDLTKVFVNGNWIGCHRNATELVTNVKNLRRNY